MQSIKQTRTERAAAIVKGNGVTLHNSLDRTFDVTSQTTQTTYRVNLKRGTCDCKDFERTGFACKHMLAAQQFESAERTARDTAPLAPRRTTYAELFAQFTPKPAAAFDLFAVEFQL